MTQITLGNGTGTIDFAGSPPSSLLIATNPEGLAGIAYFESDVGSYTFGHIDLTFAGSLVGGNFPTSIDQTFGYSAPDGDALTGVVHWDTIKDNSPNPDMIGTLHINSVTGDGAFTSSFVAGTNAHIDLVLAFVHPSQFLDTIAATTDSTWTAISAGQVVPESSLIPEPGTFILLGVALAAWRLFGKSDTKVYDTATAT